jgi:hypothetical protein
MSIAFHLATAAHCEQGIFWKVRRLLVHTVCAYAVHSLGSWHCFLPKNTCCLWNCSLQIQICWDFSIVTSLARDMLLFIYSEVFSVRQTGMPPSKIAAILGWNTRKQYSAKLWNFCRRLHHSPCPELWLLNRVAPGALSFLHSLLQSIFNPDAEGPALQLLLLIPAGRLFWREHSKRCDRASTLTLFT